MKYSLSPLAKTPPINLPFIPGVTKSFERPSPLASYEEEKKTEETTETKKPKIEANEGKKKLKIFVSNIFFRNDVR